MSDAIITAVEPAPAGPHERVTWLDVLPDEVYKEFIAIKAELPGLINARPLRQACDQVAARIGSLSGSALYRRVRSYIAAGKDERMLVNKKAMAGLWERDQTALPAAFQEFFRGLREKHQRVATEAHKELIHIWTTRTDATGRPVDTIPGYDQWPPAHPLTGVPAGWTYGNLQKVVAADPWDDAAVKQGLYAASEFRPPVLTTRVGLRLGERVEFDDHEFDLKVHFPGQNRAMRPFCFGAIDGLSGFAEIVTRPIFWDEATETKKKYTEFQFRCFVVHWLTTHGYRTDVGTTFFTEAGTAAIREAFAKALYDETMGMVRTSKGRVFGEATHQGQYRPRGKGNPRFKAQIEGFWSIIENALDRLPGRTGSNARLNGPAQLHGQEKALERILKLLPALPPERVIHMKLPFLSFQVFAKLAFEAMATILDADDHALEGWEQLGFQRLVWRPDQTAIGWYDEAAFLRLPEGDRQALAPLLRDPALNLVRSQNLSRREVWQRHRGELTRCSIKQYHRLFPVTDGFEVTVTKQRLIEFRDRERFGPQDFVFLARDERRMDFLPGEKFLAFFNPLNPQRLQLCKSDGSHVAMVEAWDVPGRNDEEAIKRQMGQQSGWESTKRHRAASRHFDEAEQRLHIAEHNAAVAAGEPITDEERAQAKERLRGAAEADFAALDAPAPAREESSYSIGMDELNQL